jgi:hypothetical protein
LFTIEDQSKMFLWVDVVVHDCNPSYVAGIGRIVVSGQSGQKNILGLVGWLRWESSCIANVNSNPSTAKKKKREKPLLKNNLKQNGLGIWLK